MISYELLKRLNFETDDIEYILDCEKKYGDIIHPFSSEFMLTNGKQDFKPYEIKQSEEKYNFAAKTMEKVSSSVPDCDNEYVLQLLFWLHCLPFAKKYYDENGISEEIFYDTMKDISVKTRECKEQHGKTGTFTVWFFLYFDYLYFALGRLQFYTEMYNHKPYKFSDYEINPGDRVYSCHIPSGERLTTEMCMDSFGRAYEFYKDEIEGDILPLICRSWLIYPNYIGRVFPEGSNMEKFAKLFDITETIETGRKFGDCARVFGVPFEGTTEGFPSDNTLRRNFIEYINSGGEFGGGIGIILYDGVKKEIINQK